jgi:hypothetical protein
MVTVDTPSRDTIPFKACPAKAERNDLELVTLMKKWVLKIYNYQWLFFRLEEIQTENMKLKVENQKLSRRMETIRTDNQTILDLEGVGR